MAKKQIGDIDYNVEFNDSVLSTKTWNNPRYDGCETKTQELNKFTRGDISYGKKTAVQKYTRNIYVGEIITSCSGSDDPNLVPFPNFSYVSTTKYITVNDDDNINEVRYSNNVIDEKIGFYRSFQEDFAVGSDCQILLLNEGIVNSLEDKYGIYFNEGILKKILFLNNTELSSNIRIQPGSTSAPGGDLNLIPSTIPGTCSIFPNSETFNTYTGSLSITDITLLSGSSGEVILTDIFESIVSKISLTDNRYFNTVISGSNDTPNLSISIINNQGIKTGELTSNYEDLGILGHVFRISSKYNLNTLGSLDKISYYISKLNESIPSILINLPKDEHLPNGLIPGQYIPNPFGGEIIFQQDFAQRVGPKFVIIPENLHPYIKENINYFLIKAGLMEENNKLTINPKNRQLS